MLQSNLEATVFSFEDQTDTKKKLRQSADLCSEKSDECKR